MALPSFVISLLAASSAALATAPVKPSRFVNVSPDRVARAYMEEIEKSFKIDPASPPYYKWRATEEPTCFAYVLQCNPVYFHLRNYFVNGSVEASYVPHTDYQNVNLMEKDTTLSISESTAVAHATTQGWTAGAKLSVAGDAAGITKSLEISSGLSSSSTETKTSTKTVSTHAVCRGGYSCEMQTWTFHVKITGECKTRPFINCGGAEDACDRQGEYACSQLRAYQETWCGREKLDKRTPCSATMVLQNGAGEPFTKLVLVSKLAAPDSDTVHDKRDESAESIVEFLD